MRSVATEPQLFVSGISQRTIVKTSSAVIYVVFPSPALLGRVFMGHYLHFISATAKHKPLSISIKIHEALALHIGKIWVMGRRTFPAFLLMVGFPFVSQREQKK